ncbi:MAG TPA: VWA domain-containing protein [Tepidisphaeraceae bacterium]|jgi:hypothetical protein|nr:VWA domain-containing protein [Tepidisphaeraceae bacterium]
MIAAFPSFLNTLPAAIAAGVVVPSLLLLYFLKLRRKEMLISSTLLWKKAIQDLQVNAPFQRLRKNLLLFLQMLLLLLLALAFARPVMNYSPGAGKLAVIAIDRSASMAAGDVDGRRRLDEAKRLARELVDTMDKDSSAMIIAFDDGADIVRSFTNDRALLKQSIDSIQLTDRRSRLETTFRLAEAKAAAFYTDQLRPTGARPELWVYSDGRILDRHELALRLAELKFVKIGSDDAPNVGIVALNSRRNYERPTEVQVFARLANFGPKPVSAVLQLSVDGQVVPRGVKRDLLLVPERWDPKQREEAEKQGILARDSVEFNLELLTAAVVSVQIKEVANDLLPADDTAHVIVPPPRSLSVVMVSGKGNLWLEKFLDSANLKNPATITPAAYEERMKDPQAVATQYDVIIFDRYTPKSLPPSGNFIYNGCVPPNSKIIAAKDGIGQPVILKDQTVLDWDRAHPILRYLNMRFLAVETFKLQVPLDAQVLIEGRQAPLVVLHRDGRNTHLVFAFDVGDTTWPTTKSFPIFLDNALQFMALGSDMDLRASYQPGATPKIPRYNLQQVAARKVEVITPDDRTITVNVPESGDFALPPLEKVGVYRLQPAVPQYDHIAVNLLDENESNLLPQGDVPGGAGEAISAAGSKSRLELWWWIVACAAIPLCLLEWWVYTRRMHL